MFAFNAKYLPALDLFSGKQDVRFYLNGYSVTPHPQGGVLLRATDGHTAILIHDKDGQCEGQYILANDSDLVRHARLSKEEKKQADARRWVQWTGKPTDRISIVATSGDMEATSEFAREQFVLPLGQGFVDGAYPETDRIVPLSDDLSTGLHGVVQPQYLARLEKLHKAMGVRRWCGARMWSKGGDGSGQIAVRLTHADMRDMLVILMPARDDTYANGPDIESFRTGSPEPASQSKAA